MKAEDLLKTRQSLPIWKHKETLITTIKQNQHCVIVSSTGSGKTTQIPQFLLEKNMVSEGIIAVTQPRRVAAVSVALRVADELGEGPVGIGPVGYCVRFEDTTDFDRTKIKYMTDGMLLREAILDPLLSRYRFIILDEAHERSLNTDVLFGVVLTAAQQRSKARALWRKSFLPSADKVVHNGYSHTSSRPPPPLKIIVMSATIDPTPFVQFLNPDRTKVIYLEGKPFPIKVLTTSKPSTDYVSDAALACMQIHNASTCPPERGILIFLTGEDEIMRCCALIKQLIRAERIQNGCGSSSGQQPSTESLPRNLIVFPLFSALPQGKQLQALSFAKPNCRKVIVSTNLAETSITIPGIRYVIDCGKAKVKYWDSCTGLETFRVQPISKSQAWQRAGRAGREAAGVCLRLFTDKEYHDMRLHPQPEMERAPLAGVLLNLISMNIKDPKQFPWLSAPSPSSVHLGLQLLFSLQSIENLPESTDLLRSESTSKIIVNGLSSINPTTQSFRLSSLGLLMSAFPLEPRFSRTIISAGYSGCLIEVLTVVSMLYVCPIFYVPFEKREQFYETQIQFHHPAGDLASLLLIYRAFVKSSRSVSSKNPQPTIKSAQGQLSRRNCRQNWCKLNMLNRARLDTAVRVRAQLKQIARGAGLAGSALRSCGEHLHYITKAFLMAGFRDQVVCLAESTVSDSSQSRHALTAAMPSINPRQRIYVQSRSIGSSTPSACYFIHPESQMYQLALSSPPTQLLFIETITHVSHPISARPVGSSTSSTVAPSLIYMRHVSPIPMNDNLELDKDESSFTHWLNQVVEKAPSAYRHRPEKRCGNQSNTIENTSFGKRRRIVESNEMIVQKLLTPAHVPIQSATKKRKRKRMKANAIPN